MVSRARHAKPGINRDALATLDDVAYPKYTLERAQAGFFSASNRGCTAPDGERYLLSLDARLLGTPAAVADAAARDALTSGLTEAQKLAFHGEQRELASNSQTYGYDSVSDDWVQGAIAGNPAIDDFSSSSWKLAIKVVSKYQELMSADSTAFFVEIQDDLNSGKLTIGSRIEWASRLPATAYHNNLPHGAASGVIRAANTGVADGGRFIDVAGYQIESDIGAKTDIYQWGADGNGSDVKEISELAIAYLDLLPIRGWLDYVDGTHVVATVISGVGVSDVEMYASAGAVIKKPDSQTSLAERQNSAIFRFVRGVKNIEIHSLVLTGNMTSLDASSGSQPLIMVGDYIGGLAAAAPAEEEINENVSIHHCTMSGSNWACVVFYGGQTGSYYQKNINMTVSHCQMSDSSTGIFSYKNAENHNFEYNQISNTSQNSISFDTRAQSDATEVSLPMIGMNARFNVCSEFGKSGQGSGILWKGLIFDSVIEGNIVKDAVPDSAVVPSHNVGIFAGVAWQGFSPSRCKIINNRVTNIHCSGLNGIGIWCSAGVSRMHIEGNYVYDCKTITLYMFESSGTIKNNVFKNGDGYFHVRIQGSSANPIKYIRYEDNVSDRTDDDGANGGSTVGIQYTFIDDLWDSNNELIGGFAESLSDVTRRNGATL